MSDMNYSSGSHPLDHVDVVAHTRGDLHRNNGLFSGNRHIRKRRPYNPVQREERGPNQHVIAHEEGWAVQAENNVVPTFMYDTREEAFAMAHDLAWEHKSNVILHDETGAIVSIQRHRDMDAR